jgi:integrase
VGGKRHRKPAKTRSWDAAEDKRIELQEQLDRGGAIIVRADADRPTLDQSVTTFIEAKRSEGISPRRVKKLEHQLTLFEQWTAERGKFYPQQLTASDVIEFRSSWDTREWKATTKVKAQQNLRTFLRFCCRENLNDLLSALKTIRLSKDDRERLEPKPFTEKEIKILLAQIPRTFSSEQVAQATLLVKFMIATGTALRDTVQLKRESIRDGWLRLRRQKTGRPVVQRLDVALCKELSDGNGKYVFWNEEGLVTSAVTTWQDDLRELMKNAGLWIAGNTSHRFRDTAVDYWLGQGWSMTEIAAALGDTVAVCERHYADLASKRMEQRLAKAPVRQWSTHA